MVNQNQVPTTRGNPSIDYVLLSNFATMVDEYRPRAHRAEESARRAQHQVHVLSRHVDVITETLDHANDRILFMEGFIQHLTQFTSRVLASFCDDNEDDYVIEYNRIVNEYNRNHPIDLTEEEDN